jgi:hypothetical protein
MNDLKKSKIKETLHKTKERRNLLDCKVYELKVDKSHLSQKTINDLNLLFIESKWLYNHILSSENIFNIDTKIDVVNALDKDKNKTTKELNILGSQIKQSLHSRMIDSTRALAKLKKHGFKVGKLKFKSKINSIPLKQYGTTYRFHKSKKNYAKIQNIQGYLKLNGLNQIPEKAEFANATLIKRNDDYYLMMTCFVPKEIKKFKEKEIGIDFGIESTITLSNGKKYKVNIPESKRSRRLRSKLSRKQGTKKKSKKSKSYCKNLNILNRSISKTNNKKKDIKNKIVSELVNTYETICIQDESIKQWKDGNFGKQVHNSILGGIMVDLKNKSNTLKIVDKYVPTSQLCLNKMPDGQTCFKLNKFKLKNRIYSCGCGKKEDRDIHSANSILEIGMGRISFNENDLTKVLGEHTHSKTPMEGTTTASCLEASCF